LFHVPYPKELDSNLSKTYEDLEYYLQVSTDIARAPCACRGQFRTSFLLPVMVFEPNKMPCVGLVTMVRFGLHESG
jgi:hypothetical protein